MTPKHKAPHARLFAEPEARAERPADVTTAYIDGASRGNPGPASYAVILKGPDGKVMLELGKYFGRATNNVAEYYGLINALDSAASRGVTRLRVRSDSELLVRQIEGRYKVKSADLKPLFERAQKLARGFAWFGIEYIPREENREADKLANAALDRTGKSSATREGTHGEIRNSKFETRKIRARYSNGALIPAEPLDLSNDAEVEITIHRAPRS
jgi:ribonuclease HI